MLLCSVKLSISTVLFWGPLATGMLFCRLQEVDNFFFRYRNGIFFAVRKICYPWHGMTWNCLCIAKSIPDFSMNDIWNLRLNSWSLLLRWKYCISAHLIMAFSSTSRARRLPVYASAGAPAWAWQTYHWTVIKALRPDWHAVLPPEPREEVHHLLWGWS